MTTVSASVSASASASASTEMPAILIIEDDAEVREAMMEVLESTGFSVITAKHGSDALAMLAAAGSQSARLRLILLDLNMPVMNGYQFRAAQQKDPELRTIPTFVLTASDQARTSVADLGVAGALKKPITMSQLVAIATKYCL